MDTTKLTQDSATIVADLLTILSRAQLNVAGADIQKINHVMLQANILASALREGVAQVVKVEPSDDEDATPEEAL